MNDQLSTLETRYGQLLNFISIALAIVGALLVFFSGHTFWGAFFLLAGGGAFVFEPFRLFLLQLIKKLKEG
jgi:hypothetical protein